MTTAVRSGRARDRSLTDEFRRRIIADHQASASDHPLSGRGADRVRETQGRRFLEKVRKIKNNRFPPVLRRAGTDRGLRGEVEARALSWSARQIRAVAGAVVARSSPIVASRFMGCGGSGGMEGDLAQGSDHDRIGIEEDEGPRPRAGRRAPRPCCHGDREAPKCTASKGMTSAGRILPEAPAAPASGDAGRFRPERPRGSGSGDDEASSKAGIRSGAARR